MRAFAVLADAVRAGMARYGVPGVALGLIDGDARHLEGFGVASLERTTPVHEATPFPVASITKTVVATALVRLAEQGRMELDAPVRRYVPELRLSDPATTDALTTAHLLSHTGGFQGDAADGAYGVTCGPGDDALARFVGIVAHLPQHAPPGRMWAYSNTGFALAGRVIEVVTGRSFEAACEGLVLQPLGMRGSFFAPTAGEGGAVGHRVREGKPEVARGWTLPRMLYPAGGLVCPPRELLRYARFHLGDGRAADGERLLSSASMALMRGPRVGDALHNGCLASFADDVGLSWFSRATPGGRLLVHGGWTSLSHRLVLVPERRFAVFVLTNADMGAQLHADVTKQALRDCVGIDGLDAVPLLAPPDDPVQYAGTYRFADPEDEEVEVTTEGDRLALSGWGKAAFYAPDRVVGLEGVYRHERGQFLRDEDGRITFLRMAGALARRLA